MCKGVKHVPTLKLNPGCYVCNGTCKYTAECTDPGCQLSAHEYFCDECLCLCDDCLPENEGEPHKTGVVCLPIPTTVYSPIVFVVSTAPTST